MALGVYDINTLGTNTEIGAQYESLNDKAAGVTWLRKPNFLNNRNLKLGIDLWNVNRSTITFERNSTDERSAYTLEQKKLNSFIEYKWNQDFFLLGFSYTYNIDNISEFGLTDEYKQLNKKNELIPDDKNINRWHTMYFHIGNINYKNYLLKGKKLTLKSSLITQSRENDNSFNEQELTFQYYKLVDQNKNIAWNFKLKSNNFNSTYLKNSLGGLGEVRGFLDGQFIGNSTVQSNLEYRFDIFDHKWGIIQATVFSDQGKEASSVGDLLKDSDNILVSSGLGLRFINPKIYRFVARIDYAQTHTRSIQRGIAFGVQQFF